MTQQERISDIILQLKQIRKERGLSLQDIHDLVKSSGGYLSLSSIKRVFSDGSENLGFRYHDTIQPIVRALLSVNEETPVDNDLTASEIDALKNVILLKDSIIAELQKDTKALSRKNEELEKSALQQAKELQRIREESQRMLDHLLTQITRLRQEVDGWRVENDRKAKIIDKFLEHKNSPPSSQPSNLTIDNPANSNV